MTTAGARRPEQEAEIDQLYRADMDREALAAEVGELPGASGDVVPFRAPETEAPTPEARDLDSPVSNAPEVQDAIEFEPASFGALGGPASEPEGDLEPVAGYARPAEPQPTEAMDDTLLLDVWYAEFADAVTRKSLRRRLLRGEDLVQEVVIGPDDRVQITSTTLYPWRAICSLRITAADDSQWIGTGWLVGARTLITAGHVVYIHSRGGWVKRIEVIPGRNGAQQPYNSCTATAFRSVTGWTQDRKRTHDYGAIILPASCRYGDQLGHFGYGHYGDGTLNQLLVNLSGYPGDKPAGTQWYHARQIKQVSARTLVYDIDTAGGQSGSPVWWYKDGQRYAVGIHTNGHLSGNSATRIVKPVFDNIQQWKQQGS